MREALMRGLLSIFLVCICNGALAQQNPPPRLIPIGCNFDGGLAWLALGKASAGPELKSFRVEISDVDLESVEATISPSKMDMFMPYGLGPVVGPINVASASIAPRHVDGVLNGNVVTIHFNILSSYSTPAEFLEPGSISYILVLNNKSMGCRRWSGAWLTFGFGRSLDEAAAIATVEMVTLMGELYGFSARQALSLASLVVDLRITQMVNGVRGVHAVLRDDSIDATAD